MKENLRPWDGTTPERLRSGALAPVSATTCTASFNWG